ncbi:hypothetical protein OUZ56_032939 [Daphnia magna]|uniref:DDE Tnp4 domain-containing protein n=1 Tax=Daphnia magna TaxID=35525 RepID=A0ABQ9ZXB1_9CRUS|nr:hypothetical protein OUZ56_032939 [Daphnia magna]
MNDDRGFNEELEFFLNDLDEMNYELTSSDDEEARRERRIEVRRRMVPFYSRRTDMYDEFFNDDQLYKTFRFDRASLQFIEGLINDKLERKLNGRKFLTPMQQILAALNFYATGTFKKRYVLSSQNLLVFVAICDANGRALSVYAKKPGSTNDAAMFVETLSRRQPDFDDDIAVNHFEEQDYDNQPDRQENLAQAALRLRRQGFEKRNRMTLNDFTR